MTNEERKPYREIVADLLIKQLKEGTAPWQKPWDGINKALPHNPITGNRYCGGNQIVLQAVATERGYKDSRWMTIEQANNLKGWVKNGEKSVILEKWRYSEMRKVRDEGGMFLIGPDGKAQLEEVRLARPKKFSFRVYNFEQIRDLPKFIEPPKVEFDVKKRAEAILKESGAKIYHDKNDRHDRASYRLDTDKIHLPMKEMFKDELTYYATAFHELGHWTRHPDRLNRDSGKFGTPEYAKEMLRVEIASMMIGRELDVGHNPDQHASYVASWIYVLENDANEIYKASRDAEKIFNCVMSFDKDKSLYEDKYKTAEVKPREKIFLVTKHEEKDEVNSLGASYSKKDGAWYIFSDDENIDKFSKWMKTEEQDLTQTKENLETKQKESLKTKAALERIYFHSKYKEKDEIKALGGTYDPKKRSWYITEDQNKDDFKKWLKPIEKEKTPEQLKNAIKESTMKEKVYFRADYEDRFEVRKLGGDWDNQIKSWYVPEGEDVSKFGKWINQPQVESSPVLQFKHALAKSGLLVDEPIMDGKFHRVGVDGDKPGAKSGSYKGFLDGHPNGVITNFKAGIKGYKWKADGKFHGDQDIEKLLQENMIKRKLNEVELVKQYEVKSLYATDVCKSLKKETQHPYLESKGLTAEHFQDSRGNIVLPLQDMSGKIWSIQTIRWNGDKQLLKKAKMSGTFHPLNEFDPAKKTMVSESFSTAHSIKQAFGDDCNVIVAVSSNNLLPVAKEISKYQDGKNIIICGDDDHKTKENAGRVMAISAANEVGGVAVFPKFNQQEKDKNFTDFNDLHLSRGLDFLKKNLDTSNYKGISR